MIRIVSLPDDLKDIRNSNNLYRFDLKGDEFPFNTFDYYVDMKIVAFGTGENRTILKNNKEYLQQRINKAIEYIERNCLEFNNKYACQGLNNDNVDVLLDILRGEDNE